MPRSFMSRSARARLVTVTTGTVSAAPHAALATVALTPTARSFGTMTACAPNASALRRQAPRLCGSVTPSSTSSSGGFGQAFEHVVERDVRQCSVDDRRRRPGAGRCRPAHRAARRRPHARRRRPPRPARPGRARAGRDARRRRRGAHAFRTLAQARRDGVESGEITGVAHRCGVSGQEVPLAAVATRRKLRYNQQFTAGAGATGASMRRRRFPRAVVAQLVEQLIRNQ